MFNFIFIVYQMKHRQPLLLILTSIYFHLLLCIRRTICKDGHLFCLVLTFIFIINFWNVFIMTCQVETFGYFMANIKKNSDWHIPNQLLFYDLNKGSVNFRLVMFLSFACKEPNVFVWILLAVKSNSLEVSRVFEFWK